MTDTLILPLDFTLKSTLLALRVDSETLEDVALRLLRQAAKEAVPIPDWQQRIRNHPELKELLRRYKYDPNEMLGIGMTVGEYDSLSEEEQAAIWDREMEKELDKTDEEPERDVSPIRELPFRSDAVGCGTKCNAESRQHRPLPCEWNHA